MPQFALSEFVSTHVLPQSVPLLHRQLPPEQYCPEGHARPQPPQFALLLSVFTQAPEQSVSPPGQLVTTHAPFTQDCPPAQARPHAPQFAALTFVFTHAPAHNVSPHGHTHCPPEHTRPAAQLPQVKQPLGDAPQVRPPQSFAIGTQALPFHVWHCAHPDWHCPLTHGPLMQLPQEPPQPFGDAPHTLLPQSAGIAGCVQTPSTHTSRVQRSVSSVQPSPLVTGTQRVPSWYWHAGHGTQRPSTHAAFVQPPHDCTQPLGEGPHARAPQSLGIGLCRQTPVSHTSRVHALPSSLHAVLSGSGTHRVPFHPWQSGHRPQYPIWQ